ncbi:MAG: deaminase [Patescibacteria group bacterium]
MSNENKLSWDELFITSAVLISARGSCDRLRTACVLVKNRRIVGTGYNGSVSGLPSCDDDGVGHLLIDGHCLRTLHGEANAIHNSVADLEGATAYVVATPCLDCVKALLQNGVKRIVYVGSYENAKGKNYVEELCRDKAVRLDQWASDVVEVLKVFQKALARLQGPGGIFRNLPKLEITMKEVKA